MIFYLHIPKTGGQTLATRLAAAYLPDRAHVLMKTFAFPQDVEEFRYLLATKDFVEGHLTGPVLKNLKHLRVLTTVRNPVEQIISTYRHIRREPRNILYRPATLLDHAAFFDGFADHFTNFQSRYLATSFFEPSPGERLRDMSRWILEHVPDALVRLHWLVPTERIDEFSILWSLETNRHVPNVTTNINVSEPNDSSISALRAYLRTRHELYDVDMVLWNCANRWFDAYRREIVTRLASPSESAPNSTRAYYQNGCGIWLTNGWHTPMLRSDGVLEWWAGPSPVSRLRFVRGKTERFLRFEVVCVLGFKHSEIVFFGERGANRLPSRLRPLDRGTVEVTLDIGGLAIEDAVMIEVPQVLSGMQISEKDDSSLRRSFASQNWSLEKQLVGNALVAADSSVVNTPREIP
jgi:hypothetical protein